MKINSREGLVLILPFSWQLKVTRGHFRETLIRNWHVGRDHPSDTFRRGCVLFRFRPVTFRKVPLLNQEQQLKQTKQQAIQPPFLQNIYQKQLL